MENKLARLFDYQKYSPNDKLSVIIKDVESRYSTDIEVLSDDELGMLNAAGNVDSVVGGINRRKTTFPDGISTNRENQAKNGKI